MVCREDTHMPYTILCRYKNKYEDSEYMVVCNRHKIFNEVCGTAMKQVSFKALVVTGYFVPLPLSPKGNCGGVFFSCFFYFFF